MGKMSVNYSFLPLFFPSLIKENRRKKKEKNNSPISKHTPVAFLSNNGNTTGAAKSLDLGPKNAQKRENQCSLNSVKEKNAPHWKEQTRWIMVGKM